MSHSSAGSSYLFAFSVLDRRRAPGHLLRKVSAGVSGTLTRSAVSRTSTRSSTELYQLVTYRGHPRTLGAPGDIPGFAMSPPGLWAYPRELLLPVVNDLTTVAAGPSNASIVAPTHRPVSSHEHEQSTKSQTCECTARMYSTLSTLKSFLCLVSTT